MSGRKDKGMWLIIIGILMIVATTFIYVVLPNLPQSTTDLKLGDGVFRASIAANDTDRAKGLSGVTQLASNQALLMAYPSDSKWGIWMKDMKVPIDIVWLNSDKKVVYIVKNVAPDDSTSVTYTPKTSAKYVVELPAGTVDSKAINPDSMAVFQINESDIK